MNTGVEVPFSSVSSVKSVVTPADFRIFFALLFPAFNS
jgi:hypothetical protein